MLADTLKALGPCLSTDLTDYLVTHRGLSPAAARQRVSRGAPQIKRLAHLPFARKARFLYHQDDYASPHYWESLYAAIFATNGPYARALGAVQAREVVPLGHFLGACGAPIVLYNAVRNAQGARLADNVTPPGIIPPNTCAFAPLQIGEGQASEASRGEVPQSMRALRARMSDKTRR